ncbi:calcium-binding protein [Methylobacterium sp. A54F]
MRLLTVDGQPLTARVDANGFFGAAFVTSAGQVIIAFEGTDLGSFEDDPEFAIAQVLADYQIYLAQSPPAYGDALSFTQTAIAAATAQGYARSDIYLSGHSLGAAEVQYVAAQTGLSGATFGGPGIPLTTIPAGRVSSLTNYVEFGDPVGNFSSNPNYEAPFLSNDQVVRYGDPTYIGDPLDRLEVQGAAAFFYPGAPDSVKAVGAGLFLTAAYEHHLLIHYAEDLNTSLAGSTSGADNVSPAQAAQIIASVLNDGVPISGGLGADVLVGSAVGDAVRGGAGNDLMSGLAGDDRIFGNAGDDTAYGNAGADLILGSRGADQLRGGQGADTLYGGQDADAVYGDLGNDYVSGDRGDDRLFGNRGADLVLGGQGADSLYGGQGADTLFGGQGNDVLSGDLGDDVLSGDLGADRYVLGPNAGADLILGFDQASGDRLDLQGQTYTAGTAADGSVLLRLSGGGTVELSGVTAAQFGSGAGAFA